MVVQEQRNVSEDLIEKLIVINRVVKVVKGGRRVSFSALAVVGDGKGLVGFGMGKAREATEAKTKAIRNAKRYMIRVPLREGRTIHHDVQGAFGAGKVVLRSAPMGTGIRSGAVMRAIFEAVGISDLVTKSLGTSNAHNVVRATFNALENINSPKKVAIRRGKSIGSIVEQAKLSLTGRMATTASISAVEAKEAAIEEKEDEIEG